ncbi:hypothetical protein ACOMHN_009982 [Nucella lapillus]
MTTSQQARRMAERFINAAKDGYLDVLQQATKRDLNWPDEDGMTAVSWAARNGHLDALRLIVGRGVGTVCTAGSTKAAADLLMGFADRTQNRKSVSC